LDGSDQSQWEYYSFAFITLSNFPNFGLLWKDGFGLILLIYVFTVRSILNLQYDVRGSWCPHKHGQKNNSKVYAIHTSKKHIFLSLQNLTDLVLLFDFLIGAFLF